MRTCWLSVAWLVLFCLTAAFAVPMVDAQDKKAEKDKKKSGTVLGVVTKKGKNFLEVKAFGEEEPRQYFPHWKGGLPKDGGGLDKQMLATFAKLKIGDRVRLEWEFEERPRAVRVELIKKEN